MSGNEKEVTVKITTDVDDENVRDLEETLNEINNSEINLGVETDDTSLDDAGDKVDDLDGSSSEVTVDADDSSVNDAGDKVDGLDGKEVTVKVGADTSSAEESVNGLNDAVTAVSAAATLAGMEQLVDTAGNINDSWNRLSLTFGGVSDQMKTDISEAGEATSRSGSLIRAYFNDMGIAGVTNTELLQQSFEALAGRAYQTGNSIESMEQKMKMIVMSGNAGTRQLTQLGLSTADLGRVMGVSADEASKMFKTLSQEERLRVLTEAMGDGKNANEMYKNSWQGLKDQVDKATGALMGAVGNMILPFLIPAMQVATQAIEALAEGFKGLDPSIKGVIGGVLAVVMGFLALTTIIGTVQAVAGAINFVKTATQLWSAVTRVATAVQGALNAVMMMNPYVLIAVAIIALIAALVYLYMTCEPVRNAIDGFGQALWGLGEAIYGGIAGALQWLIDTFTWLWQIITGLFTTTSGEGINWLTTMMMVMMGPIGWILLLIQHWNQIGPVVSGALSSMYQSAVNWFNQTGARIHSFASNLVGTLGSAAWNAVSSFASGISGIASAIAGELDRAWSTVVSWGQQLIQRFWQIAVDAVNALKRGLGIGSPGYMYYMVEGEVNRIDDLAKNTDMPSSFATLGNNMVNNFNPEFVNGTGGNGGTGGVVNNFSFTFTGFINDEERLTDLIIKTITDEIEFDNSTAGRTV